MYFGQMESLGLSLAWKLGLHPSTFAYLSNSYISLPEDAMPVTVTMNKDCNCPVITRDTRNPNGFMVELRGKVLAANMPPHIVECAVECAKANTAELQTT